MKIGIIPMEFQFSIVWKIGDCGDGDGGTGGGGGCSLYSLAAVHYNTTQLCGAQLPRW